MDERWAEHGSEVRSQWCNMVARACARGGMLDEGLQLLDHMYKLQLPITRDTVSLPWLITSMVVCIVAEACVQKCCESGRAGKRIKAYQRGIHMGSISLAYGTATSLS